MGRLRLIVGFGLIISLGGCGTPQGQAQSINSSTVQEVACAQGVHASSAYAPLRIHIPLHRNDATLQQLTDTHKATDVEINAILTVHPQLQACRTAYLNRISTIAPTLETIIAASDAPDDDNLTDLIQKKQSWGEYTTRAKAINMKMQAQFSAAWFQQINAENDRNTQAVWQSLGNLGDTMQGIAASEQRNNQQNYENMMLNNAPGRCEDYTYVTPGTYANGSFTAGAPRTFNPCN